MAKRAARRLQRVEDGMLRVVTYDIDTNQPINSMEGYTLVQPDTNPTSFAPAGTPSTPSTPTPTDTTLPTDPSQIADMIVQAAREGGGEGGITNMLEATPRAAGNNFGYIDKPMVAEIASYLGGPIGMGAKVASSMIHHNNVMASNAARSTLGLEPVGTLTTARNTISGNDYAQGLVANIKMADRTYAVGLEATLEDGRTTLTPEEARKRSLTTGQKITEATPEEVQQAVDAVDALGSAHKGPIARVTDAVTKPVTNAVRGAKEAIIGTTSPAVTQTQRSLGLAGLSPTYMDRTSQVVGDVNRSQLQPEINDALTAIGSAAPGIRVNSGYRSPEHNARVGGAQGSRHISGTAVDVNINGLTDAEKTAVLEAAITNNVKGVGVYPSGNTLHFDTRATPTTWGFDPNARYGSLKNPDGTPNIEGSIAAAPDWAQSSLRSLYGAGTSNVHATHGPMPTSREAALASPQAPTTSLDAIQVMTEKPSTAERVTSGVFGNLGPFGEAYMTQDMQTPASSLRTGFGPNDQIGVDQINSMAKAFAGELSGEILDGIAKNDPAALAELANMTSVAVNRGFSSRYAGDIDAVVDDPTQVNSMSLSNAAVTNANYNKYGESLRAGIQGVIDGKISPTADTFSHWENNALNSMKTPGWTNASTYSERVGSHNYHSLMDEYEPSQGFVGGFKDKASKALSDAAPAFDSSFGYTSSIGSFNATGKSGLNTSNAKSMSTRSKDDSVGFAGKSPSSVSSSVASKAADKGDNYKGSSGFASPSKSSSVSKSVADKAADRGDNYRGSTSTSSKSTTSSVSKSVADKAADRGDNTRSSTSTSSKSSGGGLNTNNAKGMSERSKDDDTSKSSSGSKSSNSGGSKSSGSSGKSGGGATW